jgi:integrase
MASLTTCADGRRRIQFFDAVGERRNITLSSCTDERAREIRAKVKQLNADAITGQAWAPETARWVARQDHALYDKLAAVGLVPPREVAGPKTLAAFLDAYIESRGNKPTTITNLRGARRWLVEYFGADRRLDSITPGDADEFRAWLSKQPHRRSSKKGRKKKGQKLLHENTARRICGRAKQFFRAAVRKRLIIESPFGDMQGVSVQANKEREFFVGRSVAEKVLAACPDNQWKLLFALSRYGGLRCPSEHLALKWGDVDWEHNRITIRSPKTEHHEGKASRVIPLFPELRPYLEAVFDEASEGTEFVITRYRDTNANLRTQLQRILTRAGVAAWPKLFQNLRSTRETELTDEGFPQHVVCAWLGNSPKVAHKHYLQVTDAHFEAATAAPTAPNVVQPTVPGRSKVGNSPQRTCKNSEKNADSRKTRRLKMTPTGLEPVLPA